jgi:hypothetical protein
MSLAIYAPPRAILPIFNPADFPSLIVTTTSSTSNYTTAVATLTTINTNLTTYLAKLNNVGYASNSFLAPSNNTTYGPASATYYIKQLSNSTSVNQGWAVWTTSTISYGIVGSTLTPSSNLVGWAYNIGSGEPFTNKNQQTVKPLVNFTYYETFSVGLFQLNQAYNWYSTIATNTVAPAGTSSIIITPVASQANGYFLIIK